MINPLEIQDRFVTYLVPLFEKMVLLILKCVKVNGSEEYKYW